MRKLILILSFTMVCIAVDYHKGNAQPGVGTNGNTRPVTAFDEDDDEDEGRGAIKYWQELESKINYVNGQNGIREKDRQRFKTAGWKGMSSAVQGSRIASSTNGNWTQIYQAASAVGMGRVETVAFSPASSNTFFLGTAGGGLWQTNNNGTSYFPVTDGLPSSGVTSIAIDPNNANTMYILSGSGLGGQSASSAGVFKTTDGGTSWFQTGLSDTIGGTDPLYGYDMKMHPTNSNILFCATSRGLYKTTDAGDTWQLVLNGQTFGYAGYPGIFDIEFKPDDPSVVYAAYYNQIIYSKSTGSAGTWQSSGVVYTGYPTGGVIKAPAISRICVSAANPNSIHIASAVYGDSTFEADNGAVFYIKATFNSSATSNAISYGTPKAIAACGQRIARSGGGRAYGEIYVSQTNENSLIIGGLNFFSSVNAGSSWFLKSTNCATGNGNFHVDCGSKITVQNGYTYVVTDGGIYRQTENYNSSAAAWTDITGDIEITQLYTHDGSPQDANYYLYANQDNGTQIRTSLTSYQQFVGGDGTSCKFDKSNKNNYYGSIQNGEYLTRVLSGTGTSITPGAGASNGDEKQYSGSFVFARCFNIDETNNNTLYAMKRSFYKSTNQGSSWTRYDVPGVQQPHVIMRVAKSNTQYIYAIETDWYNSSNTYIPQKFRLSVNGGNNWVERSANLPANIIISDLAVDAQNANTIYITCYGNVPTKKIYRSTDAGANWTNLSAGLPNVDARCIALVDETKKGIYIGTDLGVYYRDNNLANWLRFSNGLPIVQIMNLYINTTLQTLSAATFGRGIFVTDLYDATSCPDILSLNGIYAGHSVYASSVSINSTGVINPGVENFVTFSTGDNIVLKPGFNASSGTGFRATIEGCDPQALPYRIIPLQRDSVVGTIKIKEITTPPIPLKTQPPNRKRESEEERERDKDRLRRKE